MTPMLFNTPKPSKSRMYVRHQTISTQSGCYLNRSLVKLKFVLTTRVLEHVERCRNSG